MKSCHLLYFTLTHFNVYFLILYIWSRPFLHPNLTITLHLHRAYLPEAHRATSESMPLWKVLLNKKEVLSSHVLAGAGSWVCRRLVIVRWAACHSRPRRANLAWFCNLEPGLPSALCFQVWLGDVSYLQRIIQVAGLPSWLLVSLKYFCWLPLCLGALFATGKTIYLNFKSWISFPVYTFQTVICRMLFNQIYFLWFLLQRNGIEGGKKNPLKWKGMGLEMEIF